MPKDPVESLPAPPPARYLTLRLDILSELMKDMGELSHQRRFGLSVREVRLLLQIHHHPGLTMSQLVALTYLEKTLVSRAVTELTRMGLVQRRVGDQDARQINLALSPQGEEVARQASHAVLDATDELLSAFTPSERKAFERALDVLTEQARIGLEKEKALTKSSGSREPLPHEQFQWK